MHKKKINCIDFNNDGSLLASASEDINDRIRLLPSKFLLSPDFSCISNILLWLKIKAF